MSVNVKSRGKLALAAAVATVSFGGAVQAQTLYWDINGTTAGSSGNTVATGTWDNGSTTSPAQTPVANWNSDPTGGSGPIEAPTNVETWFQDAANGIFRDAVFSAGGNATGAYTVTTKASNVIRPRSITIQEGLLTFTQGASSSINFADSDAPAELITLEANTSLTFANQAIFTFAAGNQGVLMKNGSTLTCTNTGFGGSFFSGSTPIKIDSGASISLNTPSLIGIAYANVITGMGGTTTLRKIGAGDFRSQSPTGGSFTKLVVTGGAFRAGSAVAGAILNEATSAVGGQAMFGIIPTTFDVDNIRLSNNGSIGNVNTYTLHANRGIFLEATGGRIDTQNAAFRIEGPISGPGGLTLDTTNYAPTNNVGVLTAHPNSTTQVLAGTNTYGGATTLKRGNLQLVGGNAIPDASAIVVAINAPDPVSGFVSGGPNTAAGIGCTVTLSASETVGSLAGGNDQNGTMAVGAGLTLTIGGNGTSTNWLGKITGATANLTKIGIGNQTLSGGAANTNGGLTTVAGGTLTLNKTAGINAIAGSATMTGGSLALAASNQIPDAATLTVNGAAANLNIGISDETVTTVSLQEGSISGTTGHLMAANPFDLRKGSVSAILAGASQVVNKTTADSVTLSGVNTYTGATNVDGGTLVLGHADTIAASSGLVVNGGGTAQVGSALPKAVTVKTLTLAGSGTVDMNDGAMVIQSGDLATVAAAVASGATLDLTWNGTGINSSVAANDPDGITAVGFATGADYVGGGLTDFAGAAYDDDDILVRTTYYGDSDLNGDTNLDDYPLFIFGLEDPETPQTWYYGDYNYSGEVDIDDFPLFIAGLENDPIQTAALADLIEMSSLLSADNKSAMLGMLSAVPEPGSLGVLGVAAAGLLARRRRNA